MRTVTPAETRTTDRGHGYALSDYLGDHADAGAGPQAYLVRQGTAELGAHFHEVDQFQVVVGGEGTLGRDPVRRGVVHYADAFTAYGPIRTDPDAGLAYVTLQLEATTGINPMPRERAKRRAAGGGGEHFTCALDASARPATGPASSPAPGAARGRWGCGCPPEPRPTRPPSRTPAGATPSS